MARATAGDVSVPAVDRERFLTDGFLILRELVPPDELARLRAEIEVMVARQRAASAGGWEKSAQPRVQFDAMADAATTETIRFFLGERTLGVARRLIDAPDVFVTGMGALCSPDRDHGTGGHRGWHRDIHPVDQAPLRGLQEDLRAYGPGYVQWNIPLYDDKVLWVVPGSHVRLYTADEDRELRADDKRPLSSGVPVDLKAGDAVVYANLILHWGSVYDAKLRRTLHMGYRGIGGPAYPYSMDLSWQRDLIEKMPEPIAGTLARFSRLFEAELDLIAEIFRAMIARDAAAVRVGLARLHPGEVGRMTAVVLLSKLALQLRALFRRDLPDWPEMKAFTWVTAEPRVQYAYAGLARRLSSDEVGALWERFAPLDERLRTPDEQFVPAFQSGPMRYAFEEMPASFGVEEFIRSWR